MPKLKALKRYRAFDFSGGLDNHTSPTILAYAQDNRFLTQADNLLYVPSGGVAKRRDSVNANTTSLGANVAITGGRELRQSTGTDRVIVGTTDGRLVRIDTDGTTTNLATGLSTGSGVRWSFDQYNDLLICCNGVDAPRKTDGTPGGTALLGGSPPTTARKVLVHRNHVLLFDATNPSRLTISATDNPEDYTTANDAATILVDLKDGMGPLTDMVSLTTGEAILWKDYSVHRLQGSGFSTWTRVPQSSSVGCQSLAGACSAGTEAFWVAPEGVYALSGVTEFGDFVPRLISDPIEQYFMPDEAEALTFVSFDTAVTCFDRHRRLLFFAMDSDGDGLNDILLVYSLLLKAWSVWPTRTDTTKWGIASLWLVRNSATGVQELYAGGYDGFVRILHRESTNPITATFKHLTTLGEPGTEKSLRRLYLYFDAETATTLRVTTEFDFGASGGQTYVLDLADPESHLLGLTWVLGVDPLGGKTRVIKRIDTRGLGDVIGLTLEGLGASEPWTFLGYEAHYRERRIIRRGD
jgi:hypothetical protein